MARYTGPKTKIARKFGEPIFGEDKSFEKKNYPPGQHGNNRRRGKKSEYSIQLMEKLIKELVLLKMVLHLHFPALHQILVVILLTQEQMRLIRQIGQVNLIQYG